MGVAGPWGEAKVFDGQAAPKEDARGAQFRTVEFLGVRFTDIGIGEALAWLRGRDGSWDYAFVVTPNVDHVLNIGADAELRRLYEAADLCLCDSRVLAGLARLGGVRLQVSPGSELAPLLLKSLEPGRNICLIAANDRIARRMAELLPGIRIHCHVPPMGLRHDKAAQAEAAAFIRAHPADYIFLAVGSPQQEMLAELLRRDGGVRGTALCVGAALEFFTGDARRAPLWMQRMSLEWAHRLLQDPRRLAHRYLVKGPAILPAFVKWLRTRSARG